MQPVFCTRRGWIENATAAKDQRAMLAVCALPIPLLLQKTKAAKGRVFKIELSKVSGNALAAEICTGRTIVCCGASIVAHFARKVRATNTQRTWPALWGITLLDFQLVLGRHNIRPPHFASKVSYSASPQGFAKCPRSAPCSGAATAILFGQKLRRDFS